MMNEDIMLARCKVLVIALVGKETAPLWWKSPNKAFNMLSPTDVSIDEVYNYLMFHVQKC